jgi:intracellular multiplication protein IcmD
VKKVNNYLSFNRVRLGKLITLALISALGFYTHTVFADTGAAIGLADVAQNITNGMENLVKLITAASFVMGFGFAAAAILKFKAHKDNPAQIPIGTPIALLFIAGALIYLPSLYTAIGETVFGDKHIAGSAKGWTVPEEPSQT